jgi:hypothetical protein
MLTENYFMAIRLANTNQYIDYGNILQPIANFTSMCWFYPMELSSYKMIIGREDNGGTNPGHHLEINASQKGGFHADNGTIMVFTNTTIALNTWYHMVGVRDTTTANQRIYLNGVLENSAAYGTLAAVTASFSIGQPSPWPTEGFIGIVDDARFYDRVLDDDEIATIYACKGSDSIFYGLQGRWLFSEGAKDDLIGNYSNISINNIQSTQSSSSGSSITLAYTAPTGNNLVLVVAGTAEDAITGRVMPTNITFNGNALTNRAQVRTTTSLYIGVGLWSKSIASGESGNIVVTWGGTNDRRTVIAYVLSEATNSVEATATSFSNTGTTTTGLTTLSPNAIVVTACANEDGYTMTTVGTDHTLATSIVAGAHAGAMGSVTVATAGSITGIGFTASPTPGGEALVMAAFTPINTTTELSNNEYVGTAYNRPTFEETFLKIRRIP